MAQRATVNNLSGGAECPLPRHDVAGDRVEDEARGRGAAAHGRDIKVGGRVGDRPRRQSAGDGHRRQAGETNERTSRHVAIEELRRTRAVVSDPEGAGGQHRDAPGVDEQRILNEREAGDVRDKVCLPISRAGRDDSNLRLRPLVLRVFAGIRQ